MSLKSLFGKKAEAAPEAATPEVKTMPVILVIDDDPLYSELISEQGKRLHVEVYKHHPSEPISKLKGMKFDAAIVDFDLGGTDGISFMRNIEKELGKIPTILVSGSDRSDIPSEAWPSSLIDFVPKSAGYLNALMTAHDFCKFKKKKAA